MIRYLILSLLTIFCLSCETSFHKEQKKAAIEHIEKIYNAESYEIREIYLSQAYCYNIVVKEDGMWDWSRKNGITARYLFYLSGYNTKIAEFISYKDIGSHKWNNDDLFFY